MKWNFMSKPGHRVIRLQPVREAQAGNAQLHTASDSRRNPSEG